MKLEIINRRINQLQTKSWMGCMSGLLLSGLLLPLSAARLAAAELSLTHDGKTDYTIVQGQSPSKAELFAAKELSEHLEKVTGAKFPITNESELVAGKQGIYVGNTSFATKQGIDLGKLDGEEWLLQTAGADVILTGGQPVGALYAVYELLENYAGCRWLDRDTFVAPSKPDLKVPELKLRGKPAFWNRSITIGLWGMEPSPEMLDKEGVFLVRNKSTGWPTRFGVVNYGSPGGCHTFYAFSKDFPADHPEYFSMNAQGVRERATSGSGPGQLCLTNPETRKLVLEQLRKFIVQDRERTAKAGQPAPKVYDISQNDNNDFICLCPNCKAFAEKEGSESGLMIDFINTIADGIKDDYPDILLMTFAYTTTLKTPKTLKPRDNVIIRLAQLNSEWAPKSQEKAAHYPDFFRPMTHPLNQTALDDLAAWTQISKHLAVWDYWILYDPKDKFPTPYVNIASLQPDLQAFLKNHVENVFVECEAPDTTSFSALKLWLGQKLLQNPNQPAEPLLQAFMNGYYGASAAKMREYLDYMEKRIAAAPGTEKMSSMREHLRPYLDLEFFTTANRLLTEAEKNSGTDKQAQLHVQHEWIPFCAALYNMWGQLEKQLAPGQKMQFDREAILKKYADCRYALLDAYYYGKVPPEDQRQGRG